MRLYWYARAAKGAVRSATREQREGMSGDTTASGAAGATAAEGVLLEMEFAARMEFNVCVSTTHASSGAGRWARGGGRDPCVPDPA
jgi:hypothetical protein